MHIELTDGVNIPKLKILLEQHNYLLVPFEKEKFKLVYNPPTCLDCYENPMLIVNGEGICMKHALENMDLVANLRKGGL